MELVTKQPSGCVGPGGGSKAAWGHLVRLVAAAGETRSSAGEKVGRRWDSPPPRVPQPWQQRPGAMLDSSGLIGGGEWEYGGTGSRSFEDGGLQEPLWAQHHSPGATPGFR